MKLEIINRTTKLRTHTSSKKGRKFRKEKSAIFFLVIRNLYSKKFTTLGEKNHNFLVSGQKYPLSLPPGGKVDISARRLLSLPAKLE